MDSEIVKGKPLTREETKCLLELIESNKIITTKTTNATNNKLKNEEWIRITQQFNATSTNYRRTPQQLRLKWENLKKNSRKRSTKIRMNQLKTGGGPPDYIPPDDILDRVTGLLGSTVSGFTVPFGGDREPVGCDIGEGGSSVDGDGIGDVRLSVVESIKNPVSIPIDNCVETVVNEYQVLDVVDQNITPNKPKRFTFSTPRTVRHITRKYQLAVAIAVIRSKPEDLPIDQFINQLKSKIEQENENNMDTNENDLDVTICSEDFKDDVNDIFGEEQKILDDINITQVSTDSVTILKGFDCEMDVLCEDNNQLNATKDATADEKDDECVNEKLSQIAMPNISQSTFYESLPISTVTNICNNYNMDSNQTYCNTLSDIEAEINNNHNASNNNNNQIHNYLKTNAKCNKNDDTNALDSQTTEIYTVYGFSQQNTHISQSQVNNFVISDKYIKNDDKISKNVSYDGKKTKNLANAGKIQDEKVFGVLDFTLNGQNLVQSSNNNENAMVTDANEDNTQHDSTQYGQNIYQYVENLMISNDETSNVIQNATKQNENSKLNTVPTSAFIHEIQMNEDKTASITENQQVLDANTAKVDDFIVINGITYQIVSNKTVIEKGDAKNQEVNKNTGNDDMEIFKSFDEKCHSPLTNDEVTTKTSEDFKEDSFDTQTEVISFKVIEELNKVKNYLNRRNERRISFDTQSNDSGFRSNSQIRCSEKMASGNNWLNQSACNLLVYIKCCQLVLTNQNIMSEISKVLGQLIDRLHDEENYPLFIEELLQYSDELLKNIYEGDEDDDLLLRTEENIQRFIYFNKSIHIIKYSIEKIICILEKMCANITNKDVLLEVEDTSKTENLCYIFHVLEILLKEYTRSKNLSSQSSSQLSQDEDRSLKRTAITDMWRKKWDPNYKNEVKNEGYLEKTCVLTRCSEILNKIVVECMDGYSLLSFVALQCFNVLQS